MNKERSPRLIVKRRNTLVKDFPAVAKEWHPTKNKELECTGVDPETITRRSNFKVWWICSHCKHEWQAFVFNRTKGQGCPKCGTISQVKRNRELALTKKGSLANKLLEIAKEWHPIKNKELEEKGLTPETLTTGSNFKVWWKCSNGGHEWLATVCSRVEGTGCPKCATRELAIKHSERIYTRRKPLAIEAPEIAAEWDPKYNIALEKMGYTPYTLTAGSNRKLDWRCKICKHRWKATIVSRVNGRGCPKCGRKKGIKHRLEAIVNRDGALAA